MISLSVNTVLEVLTSTMKKKKEKQSGVFLHTISKRLEHQMRSQHHQSLGINLLKEVQES